MRTAAFRSLICAALLLPLCTAPAGAMAGEWNGWIEAEGRLFSSAPADPRQGGNNLSLAVQPEYYTDWNNGRDSFTFVPFGRIDRNDPERTHADIRELTWLHSADRWELRLGIRKLFWGVTESQHLVDIINQTDLVEDLDGEEKLGQPMVNLALMGDHGTWDLFLLPLFRERTFPGVEGRPRFLLPVESDHPRYQSEAEAHHLDLAVRWSHSVGVWDVGVHHFFGTSRDPRWLVEADPTGNPVLVPYYDLIHQTGIDLQATLDNWLWKLEAIHRRGMGEAYSAATGGFEYTFWNIAESGIDLGVVAEYLWDERGESLLTPFEDDVMVGLRLAFNDVQSSEALIGAIFDRESGEPLFSVEANRRLGEHWKLSLDLRVYSRLERDPLLTSFARDNHLQIRLARYF